MQPSSLPDDRGETPGFFVEMHEILTRDKILFRPSADRFATFSIRKIRMLQNRRLSLACGAILAGFLLHPTAARADTHIISSSGSWEAYEGTSEDGTQLCGMDTTSDNDNGDDIDIKYFNGDDELTIQLFSNGWKIPDGKSDTKIEIKFDSESWHVNQVTGFHLDDGTSGMEFTISKDDANDFIDDFSASSNLHLAFTNSDVDDWDIDLSGSQDVVGPFKDCVRDMPKI